MKKLLMAGIVLFVAVWVMAQTFGPPAIGSDGPIATSPSQCPTSPAHGFSICPVETGAGTGTLYISVNGSAPTLLQGAPGPAGPVGPQGPTGPMGPQGPVQSFTSVNCNPATAGSTGLTASNCVEK